MPYIFLIDAVMKITFKIAVFGWVSLDMPCHAQTSLNAIVKSNYP